MTTNERIAHWIEFLALSCADLKIQHIDIIIDQAGAEYSLLPALASFTPSVQWISLFNNLPEDVLQEDAPLLIRLNLKDPLQRQWLLEIAQEMGKTEQILVLCSLWPFQSLADYLTQCVDVTCGEQDGILRFYDPRIFPFMFSHVLEPSQQQLLLLPAIFWSWLDRDLFPRQIPGNGAKPGPNNTVPRMVLNDRQQEYLMCVADVNLFLKRFVLPEPLNISQERLFLQCYQGMIAATDAGLIMDAEREEFVKNIILNDKPVFFQDE